jgi:hypothetical protein
MFNKMNEKNKVNLPQELFQQSGKNRKYSFIGLDGELNTIILRDNDYLSNQKCPIDGTNFVMVDDRVYAWVKHCYCCEGPILNTDIRGEKAEKWVVENYSKDLEKEIGETKEKLSRLENLLAISKNRDSEILLKNRSNFLYNLKENKPNLSANINLGLKVNKLKAAKITDMHTTPFPKGSYFDKDE